MKLSRWIFSTILRFTAILALSSSMGCVMGGKPMRSKAIVVQSHRGLHISKNIPENTVESLEAAYQAGARFFEFDVQRTQDGHLVVYHDGSVHKGDFRWRNDDSPIKKDLRISQLSLEQVKQLVRRDPEVSAIPIPELKDFFDWQKNREGAVLDIEIKIPQHYQEDFSDHSPAQMAQQVIKMIKDHQAISECIVRSFNEEVVIEASKEPGLKTAMLTFIRPEEGYVLQFIRSGAKILAPLPAQITSQEISKLHEAGAEVWGWVYPVAPKPELVVKEDEAFYKRMLEDGYDGMTVDRPDLALRWLRSERLNK
jgi:glycerophosphoryl diester phosphodiesterase